MRADDERRVGEGTPPPRLHEELAGRPAPDQEQGDAAGKGHEEVDAGRLGAAEGGQEGQAPELDRRGLEHAVVLVGPVTENALPVGVHGRQEEPPAGGHADVQQDVVGGEPAGVRDDQGLLADEAHDPAEEDDEGDDGKVAGT